jgi:hypothetical protein
MTQPKPHVQEASLMYSKCSIEEQSQFLRMFMNAGGTNEQKITQEMKQEIQLNCQPQ